MGGDLGWWSPRLADRSQACFGSIYSNLIDFTTRMRQNGNLGILSGPVHHFFRPWECFAIGVGGVSEISLSNTHPTPEKTCAVWKTTGGGR